AVQPLRAHVARPALIGKRLQGGHVSALRALGRNGLPAAA
ncbi:hypothetical protein MTO96_037382, partial [Rhipicephalus appendiculatus]